MSNGDYIINEKFSTMENWWVEGGENVWTEDNKLFMKSDAEEKGKGHACTAWCKIPVTGDVEIKYCAQVISSSLEVNNINFFFYYSDPNGQELFDSKAERADGDYPRYHQLNGYIVTFVNDKQQEGGLNPDGSCKARIRIRRCPGFKLLNECFHGKNQSGKTYDFMIKKQQGEIALTINGENILSAQDENPLQSGLIGLRTYRTYLWWSDISVKNSPPLQP